MRESCLGSEHCVNEANNAAKAGCTSEVRPLFLCSGAKTRDVRAGA